MLAEAAQHYASKGWRVLPLHGWTGTHCTCGDIACSSPGKHPRLPTGLTGASCDPAVVAEWWRLWPTSNIGLVTGEHFDVLDVDGPEGGESLAQLHAEGKRMPVTTRIRTGSGGSHYLFNPTGAGNRAKMLPGLDWRGKGGYIVAPPSLHPSGSRYTKETHDANGHLADVPDWLLELVAPKPVVRPVETSEWLVDSVGPEYAERALEDELARLREAVEGERNHALNRAAFAVYQLVKDGLLDHDDVSLRLLATAQQIGLSTREANRTMSSAWHSAQPRGLKVWEQAVRPTRMERLPEPQSADVGITWATDIRPKRTKWLWDGRLPQGSLSLIGGREGIGKSTAAYDLAAAVTRGKLPGEYLGEPKRVLIAAYEDDWPRTIIPRLMAAGADLSKVGRIDVVEEGGLTLPRDLAGVTAAVETNDVVLILVDPLMSRLGSRDTHKDSEVRQGLEPTAEMAQRTGCSVLGIIHVNKSGSSDPLTTLMGSRAFAAVARSVLFVMVDPDSEGERILALAKNNLGRMDIPALKFVIQDKFVGIDDEDGSEIHSGKIDWRGESPLDIYTALEASGQSKSERSIAQEVAKWLIDLLEANQGVMPSSEIKKLARQEGYSMSTLDIARNKVGISSERLPGFQATTIWKLPPVQSQLVSEWLTAEDDDD